MDQVEECDAVAPSILEKRHNEALLPQLILMELDPTTVVDGVRLDYGLVAEDVDTYGAMRETCPFCTGVHLQLVLRQTNVKIAHLYCAKCTRCFDACWPDYTSALTLA